MNSADPGPSGAPDGAADCAADSAADSEAESVVLLDSAHRPSGTAPKATVHHAETPLHLAFSCYVFDPAGRLLATRRSLGKTAWPGVWTNSVCGHPAPGEAAEDAIRRRARQELGLEVHRIRLRLPDFRYRAVDASGVVENEFCPVYEAHATDDPRPEPAEVAQWEWTDWAAFVALADRTPWAISPWAAEQAPLLARAD
ncbi:isopentenyl-diphosphate delta-isomerase [Murinocardiopsis flavida]|uniref:Isopentenyl-diphosphate Delta-isomerase n=1 Tax=Murinocardiopsis flavida TaxID=645275 RepID=A0A2P8DPC9_9ACTN|nr:isopentenyl-diphosphate Delta-isomerase [Murinocardiopsis flavida]PSK99061.1 isopentenyl-diphosphate delta-isomerase [Murinocardiopsis flavida]